MKHFSEFRLLKLTKLSESICWYIIKLNFKWFTFNFNFWHKVILLPIFSLTSKQPFYFHYNFISYYADDFSNADLRSFQKMFNMLSLKNISFFRNYKLKGSNLAIVELEFNSVSHTSSSIVPTKNLKNQSLLFYYLHFCL